MSNRARAAFKQSELRAVQEMAGGMAGMEPAGSYERGREALRAELVAAVRAIPNGMGSHWDYGWNDAYGQTKSWHECNPYSGDIRAAVLAAIEATGKEPFE